MVGSGSLAFPRSHSRSAAVRPPKANLAFDAAVAAATEVEPSSRHGGEDAADLVFDQHVDGDPANDDEVDIAPGRDGDTPATGRQARRNGIGDPLLLDSDLLGKFCFEVGQRRRFAKATFLALDGTGEQFLFEKERRVEFGKTEFHLGPAGLRLDRGLLGEFSLKIEFGSERTEAVEPVEPRTGSDVGQRLFAGGCPRVVPEDVEIVEPLERHIVLDGCGLEVEASLLARSLKISDRLGGSNLGQLGVSNGSIGCLDGCSLCIDIGLRCSQGHLEVGDFGRCRVDFSREVGRLGLHVLAFLAEFIRRGGRHHRRDGGGRGGRCDQSHSAVASERWTRTHGRHVFVMNRRNDTGAGSACRPGVPSR